MRERIYLNMDDLTDINELDSNAKNDSGFGVFSFQLILVLILAISYVLLLTFVKPISQDILTLIKEKETVDFSFKDKLYDNVGAFLTFINQQAISNKNEDNLLPSTSSAISADSGAGGNFTPVIGNEVPYNCTLAPVKLTGNISFPLKGDYSISSKFGFRDHPTTGKAEFHTAIDYATQKDETIYAVAGGTVLKSEKNAELGKYILIDHGDGFLTLYGHCNSLIVVKGAVVKAGTAIAKVGSTGDSTGNHLHFGAKKDNKYFNPEYLFK